MTLSETEKNHGYPAWRPEIPSFLEWRNLAFLVFLLLPVPVFFFSMFLGTYPLSPTEIIRVILAHFTAYEYSYPSVYDTVIFNIRFPRVLLAMMVGAALSTSGATFQGIFRNPLVSPYILGLSSGAAFGAALSIAIIPEIPVQVGAFVFSLVALGFSYTMARTGRQTSTVALVLAGVITSSIFGALLAIIQFTVDEKALQSIVYWNMGCLNTSCWSKFFDSFPLVAVGCLVIFLLRWKLNVLALGEEEAKAVGMNVERYKAIFIIASSLAASAAVAVAGIIGLAGLIVPHMLRMIFGPDHKKLIPLSITFGATFLVLVDDVARSAFSFEIPVGIITTLLGAPFFLYLLRSTKAGGWE
ncbi:Vitamin B12 ABC transporter, permease component BtuC [Methanosarcina sp. MTP4]|uniref:FecCD family ABC transporter permease n=1 Tax=Methanosarcina sp. MTP4 TaxID=1434100 RepID=UPI00061601ED|nr:iron ABC transporter permease [Methanosarcina sp. MTP4]AKB23513.1 Vitamin B12 ABC transporter, permease component BtuC [Methanosarcina sp. MTP4]